MYTYINLIDKAILLKSNVGLNAAQIKILFLKYTLFGVHRIEKRVPSRAFAYFVLIFFWSLLYNYRSCFHRYTNVRWYY